MSDTAPMIEKLTLSAGAVAANADKETTIGVAPWDATVTAVTYIAETAITGANTDSRTVQVKNKGQTGAGSATVASKSFTTGVNAPADDETAVPLSATPNLVVAAGDVLAWTSNHTGTNGLPDPGGLVTVTLSRR